MEYPLKLTYMKAGIFYLLVFALISACAKDEEEPIDEIPTGIIRKDTSPILYSRIIELLPPSKSAHILYPSLFTDTVMKKIVLTAESEVYITFVSESAKYKNTVGWYTYPVDKQPATAKDVNIQVLFPNVSGKGEGGELNQGDMLQLGDQKFPKGTVIGFFLIINGWRDGFIDYKRETHYTDSYLNIGGAQQHILFLEKNGGKIVLGFEDMPYGSDDSDFNDIIFTISDNKDGLETINFNMTNLQKL
jgi:hypothetical protein